MKIKRICCVCHERFIPFSVKTIICGKPECKEKRAKICSQRQVRKVSVERALNRKTSSPWSKKQFTPVMPTAEIIDLIVSNDPGCNPSSPFVTDEQRADYELKAQLAYC